jgi:hypothetical protein
MQALERLVMRDRQISVRRVADQLNISKTIVYESLNDHLGMKKVYTKWVPKLLTPLQRANRVECCEELLQESKEDSIGFLGRIVTRDDTWIHHYEGVRVGE